MILDNKIRKHTPFNENKGNKGPFADQFTKADGTYVVGKENQ